MAGGWGHVTNDDGTPYDGEYGMGDLLENGGDVNEAVEELYGMIWWLAARCAAGPSREQALDMIRAAREGYPDGFRLGSGG